MNSISKISFNPDLTSLEKKSNDNSTDLFGSIFNAFLNTYNETSALESTANSYQLAYATGQTDDMLSVMLAQEKAYTSLNFSVQVTNKIMESYKQIMQMQI